MKVPSTQFSPRLRARERRSTASRFRPRAVLALALLLATPVTACGVFTNTGPTPVAQGKYFSSGNAEYDEFFLELYRSQVSMAAVPQRWTSTNTRLTDELGIGRELPRDAVVEHVRARSREVSSGGRIVKLQVTPGADQKVPSAVLLTRPATRDDVVRGFAEPVEKATNDLLALRTDLERNATHFVDLERRLNDLKARANTTFVRDGVAKVHEVERNLEDAGKVLAYMREQGEQQLTETKGLLDALVAAVDTSNGAFDRPEPPAEEPEPQREARPTPSKKPARGSASGTTPTSSGSKPPKSASSTRPAPSPKAAPPSKAAPAPAPKPAPSEPAGFEP